MMHTRVPLYEGSRTACDYCGREFRPGDLLSMCDGGALIFCFTEGNKGCVIDYLVHKLPVGPRTLVGNGPRVFPPTS